MYKKYYQTLLAQYPQLKETRYRDVAPENQHTVFAGDLAAFYEHATSDWFPVGNGIGRPDLQTRRDAYYARMHTFIIANIEKIIEFLSNCEKALPVGCNHTRYPYADWVYVEAGIDKVKMLREWKGIPKMQGLKF